MFIGFYSDLHSRGTCKTHRQSNVSIIRFGKPQSGDLSLLMRQAICPGAVGFGWRRRTDSNRCIKVLQTSPLATWVRRHHKKPEYCIRYEQIPQDLAQSVPKNVPRSRFPVESNRTILEITCKTVPYLISCVPRSVIKPRGDISVLMENGKPETGNV
jgi:hypothetical protein